MANQLRNPRRVARAAALCLLALGATFSQSREARAQWTQPDVNGNITNTNTGNVGVGTATPLVKFSVLDTSTSQVNRGVGIGQVSNDANGALLSLSKSRGTPSAQTPAANGDSLATILAYGHDGVGHIASSRIRFAVNGTVGTSSVPTELQFWTGASGGGTQRMVITTDGKFGFGTPAPGAFVDGQRPETSDLLMRLWNTSTTGGTATFRIANSSNAGSRLQFTDSNSYVSTVTADRVLGLRFRTGNAASEAALDDRMAITPGGNVGIGTNSPASKLHVVGDITVTGNINAKYQDVAEWVPSTQKLQAGTVVVLDTRRDNHVLASTDSYDTRVAGVVSAQPGLSLGEAGEGKVLVATTGRVKVRVDATRAPVKVGDLLVTSGRQGYAMKSVPVRVGGRKMHSPGTIIGKALEPLAGGTGEILVLLSLQ